jgi:hypothetical protein
VETAPTRPIDDVQALLDSDDDDRLQGQERLLPMERTMLSLQDVFPAQPPSGAVERNDPPGFQRIDGSVSDRQGAGLSRALPADDERRELARFGPRRTIAGWCACGRSQRTREEKDQIACQRAGL